MGQRVLFLHQAKMFVEKHRFTLVSYEDDTLYLKLSVRTDAERCKCLSVKLYVDRREAGE